MFKELFVNASILISFLFITGQCFRESELSHNASYKIRLLGGIIAGALGSVLMFFSFHVSSTFILDFRQLALVVVSIYGGIISSIIAGFIIGFVRLILFGFNTSSLVGFITALIIAIGCGVISKIHITEKKKWLYMVAYCLFVSLIVYYILLKEFYILVNIFIPYAFGMCILGSVMYYFAQYITISNRLIRRLKEESTKDFLTGLNNVRQFDLLFNNAIKDINQKQKSISLLLIDIDFFKKINDTYGHPSGDAVLKEIGLLLPKYCRNFDIVSRNGGEEFSVLLLNCPEKQVLEIGERIRRDIGSHSFILPSGNKLNITVSIGVSTYPNATKDVQSLIKEADFALYKAKSLGRNKVCSTQKDNFIDRMN